MNNKTGLNLTGPRIYMALFSLRFTEVFWVVFLRSKGFSFAAIGLMETVFHVASLLCEMPTGLIADRWGRKVSLAVGRVLCAVSALITLGAKDLTWIAVAFALNAISYTCHSGAFEALVYDSLPKERQGDFGKIFGELNSVYLVGCSAAGFGASLFASRYPLKWLYVVSISVDLLGAVVSVFLSENLDARRGMKRPTGLRNALQKDIRGLAQALKAPVLRGLLLFWGVASALGTSTHMYGQSLLEESLVPLGLVGIAGTVGNLLAVVPTRYAYKIESRYGQVRPVIMGGMAVPCVVGILATIPAHVNWGWRALLIALYLGLTVVMETAYPLMCQAVNARTESHNRATVLSSSGMLFSIWMMVVFPLIGLAGDYLGLRWGMALAAALTLLALWPISAGLTRAARDEADGCPAHGESMDAPLDGGIVGD